MSDHIQKRMGLMLNRIIVPLLTVKEVRQQEVTVAKENNLSGSKLFELKFEKNRYSKYQY